ncbi:MAG TPA: FG-GAP-like repeat-containing protein [Vicinamibacterales bacterium]|nr:FG-GAP-like repeat-containing protein [Vicinamibacterales bacterium]
MKGIHDGAAADGTRRVWARERRRVGLPRYAARFAATATLALLGCLGVRADADADAGFVVYEPSLTPPEFLEPFLEYVAPGNDAFKDERVVVDIEARLNEFGAALLKPGADPSAAVRALLAPGFRGGRLSGRLTAAPTDVRTAPAETAAFEVQRDEDLPPGLVFDAQAFASEMRRLLSDVTAISVAEFIVTAIRASEAEGRAVTRVRYDLVGAGAAHWRVEHVGEWDIAWRRGDRGWQAVEWATVSHTASRARRPIFTDVTRDVLGGIDSFARQLGIDLDDWMAVIDSVLTRDSNGHHGVSIGDADGDGLEDLYIAQPSGLPNRLYRNRGDGTFEDATERAGVAVLDDTSMSLFADVDNDGDQDLTLAASTGLLLFRNDGTGRFTPVVDAFEFAHPLEGAITAIAMADYDRDGFLDLYVCVYSYFYGAGEDKAGTPMPYYDARTGPPAFLFRNDGTGRFVDVTGPAGLDAGNDRYHFAATWGDYDADGWIDLLVVNDFGTNNLYRNRGDGTFEDVAEKAGVLDHAAGMSAAFFDYDNDGRLDIYTGNIWSANGQRVTASPAFMPGAPPDVRALYRRHARGNSLFRNRGDGTFEDVTVAARAAMGRWAWSSDVLDFDSDGWDDLYIVNGMLTRDRHPEAHVDLDGFFWRQVVARSPLTRVRGTSYDDAWRAINQLLIHRSIAGRQRNVFLRNDGRGGFDEVSGALGLDLDQDGRAFAVTDLDRDGDPDLVVMAARQAPQLRVFRNDFADGGRWTAIRLRGSRSNRDAIGARVVVVTDRLKRTRTVTAGSGFLSQHSKELVIGLGASERIETLIVHWPSGSIQEFKDVPLNTHLTLVEGRDGWGTDRGRTGVRPGTDRGRTPPAKLTPPLAPAPPEASWLFEPFPAPEFSIQDLAGTTWSRTSLRGRPSVVLLWSAESAPSQEAVRELARGHGTLSSAGIAALAIALDSEERASAVRAAAPAGLPVAHATKEVALSFAILYRHLFMNRQLLRLPTAFLLDAEGRVARVYRERIAVQRLLADAVSAQAELSPGERLGRAVPFLGTFHTLLPARNLLAYGRELMDQGLHAAAVEAFERAAQANPRASTLYRLGTLLARSGETDRARTAYERALQLQPDLAEAHNDLGTLLAREGDLEGAIARFRAALDAAPDYPDALNNLGYALLLSGQDAEARSLYERALELQPDFPEALNNLGLLLGRAGQLDAAEGYFRKALERRATYAEAANNLALVLVARGDTDGAVRLLDDFIARAPGFEAPYLTLAKIHLSAGRTREGVAALERLLQRNPTHPEALELLREWQVK